MIEALGESLSAFLMLAILWLPVLLFYVLNSKLVRILGRRKAIAIGCVGVPVHEISHAIFCFFLGHKILKVSLFNPKYDGTLGYVEHSYRKSWFSNISCLLIGLAPLVGGFAAFLAITYLLRPDVSALFIRQMGAYPGFYNALTIYFEIIVKGPLLETLIWILLSFSILLFCCPSRADFQACSGGVFMLFVLVLAVAFFAPGKAMAFTLIVLPYAQVIGLTMMLVLAMLVSLFVLVKLKFVVLNSVLYFRKKGSVNKY